MPIIRSPISDIADLSVADREEHLAVVRRECADFRVQTAREEKWLDSWRLFRGLNDEGTPFKNRFFSTYLWGVVESRLAVIEPMFFSADPAYEFRSPRLEDDKRNILLADLVTRQIHGNTEFRQALTKILMDAFIFGASYPHVFFRSVLKPVGPFPRAVIGEDGFPQRGMDGQPEMEMVTEELKVYHAPWLQYVPIWDSFIHPDGRRGFTLREVTGRELLRSSQGPNALYPQERVLEVLHMAALDGMMQDRTRGDRMADFRPGTDDLIQRDLMLAAVGVQTSDRVQDWIGGYVDDAMSQPFPILHYDDGDYSGTYALSRTGQLMELRFFKGASPDGTPGRLAVMPNINSVEPYGVAISEQAGPVLRAHSRFLQLALDGAELTVHPTWVVSSRFADDVRRVYTGPGAINEAPTLPGEDPKLHLQRMDMPQSWQNAFQIKDLLKAEMDHALGMDDFSRGRLAAGRRSASEVSIANEFAQSRLELLANRITDQFAVPLGRKWLILDSIHLEDQDIRNLLGRKADGLQLPSVQEIVENMEVVFRGSVVDSDRQVMLARYREMSGPYMSMLPLLQLPYVQEFLRRWMQAAGMGDVSKTFPPLNPAMQTALEQQLMMGAQSAASQGGQIDSGMGSSLSAAGGANAPQPPTPDGMGMGGLPDMMGMMG